MNEHDVVRVKETVMVTPDFEDHPIEIKAGWLGTIIAHADKPIPLIEFNEEYRGKPFLVDLDAANLEVVWESRSAPMNMTFTIADDYDPDDEMSAKANPMTAYRTYLRDVRGGMVGDMGFTLDDFKTYVAGLRKPDWKKIFATVIEDHHEMFVRLAKRFDPDRHERTSRQV
jgi:hypothetical protein